LVIDGQSGGHGVTLIDLSTKSGEPQFKTKVAMEAIRGLKTVKKIAADHAAHPIQVLCPTRVVSGAALSRC
jgi:hypothetical protein